MISAVTKSALSRGHIGGLPSRRVKRPSQLFTRGRCERESISLFVTRGWRSGDLAKAALSREHMEGLPSGKALWPSQSSRRGYNLGKLVSPQ